MRWEYYVFATIIVCSFGLQQLFLYHRCQRAELRQKAQNKYSNIIYYLSGLMMFFMFMSLYGGWFFVQYWEDKEKQEIKAIMDGVAPTFAYELKRMGHSDISLDTPDDDPAYLNMIDTMVDWMKVNPMIQSIYTFHKTSQGDVVFVLGPETDYDRNGVIEGEKEARVSIGTVYKEVVPEIEAAFNGSYSFQEEPIEDKWGSSISAYMPIYGKDPKVPEAILGIDFDYAIWSQALQLERIKAISLVLGLLVFTDVIYLVFCQYWFNLQKIRQLELDRENSHLDRLNLIGQIAASIGHEVRNPMTTVRGFLQFFNRKKEFAQYQSDINLMIEELDRANSIITEFLSLAKDKRVDMKHNSLNEVLLIIKPILDTEALLMGHNIIINMGNVPNFSMDTNEIRQLIFNLFRNGLEAMKDKGTITITTHAQEGEVCLEISDEGRGVSQQILNNLGTPFVTTKEQGTGLGLAVCYRIAEHHKAKIDVTTGLGGTTFAIRFSLA